MILYDKDSPLLIGHLKGTSFQVDIWQKLVRIPEGKLSTYGSLVPSFKGAQAIGTLSVFMYI